VAVARLEPRRGGGHVRSGRRYTQGSLRGPTERTPPSRRPGGRALLFLLYTKAFAIGDVGDVGGAAAIGVVLAAVCLIISLVIVRLTEQEA
jgi:ABC-type sugar transport system permease subunit